MFFDYSIDKKKKITDPNGNEIVNLTTSIFSNNATEIVDFSIKKVSKSFVMRPDLVSIHEYGDDGEGTEVILKYSGIGNPFSLFEDDILKIPNFSAATSQMVSGAEAETITSDGTVKGSNVRDQLVKNYYKYKSDYDSDTSTYKNLTNKKISSGNISTPTQAYTTPYINTDGGVAITIKGGKMYFGDNTAFTTDTFTQGSLTTESLDSKIKELIDNTASALDSNCLYNGEKVSNIVRASYNSTE